MWCSGGDSSLLLSVPAARQPAAACWRVFTGPADALYLTCTAAFIASFHHPATASTLPLLPTCRSKHAAEKTAAPSSTGLGLSAGGPAPSDARTGAAGGVEAADTAGTDQLWGGVGESGAAEGRRRMPAVPALSTGPPKREDFERLLVRCQKKDIHSMFKDPVTEQIVSGGCWLSRLGSVLGLGVGFQACGCALSKLQQDLPG